MWALLPRHVRLVIIVWLVLGAAWGVEAVTGQAGSLFHRASLAITVIEVGVVALVQLFWRRLWRAVPLLGRYVFPDLNGCWSGVLRPVRDGAATPDIPVRIAIRQSLFSVSVRLTTADSTSESRRADLEVSADKAVFRIAYDYANRPRAQARVASPIHEGRGQLSFQPSVPDKLTGDYFTSRSSSGEIEVSRISTDPDAGGDGERG
jgi:hypothetical protein